MKVTREAVIERATALHDLRYGRDHCDRKYLLSCSRMPGLVMEAGDLLRKEAQ